MNAVAKPFQPFTSAEFHKMARRGAFDDLRVELRRGMLVKMSPKYLPHVVVQEDLTFALKLAIREAGLGWRVASEGSASLEEGFDPMPDVVVYDPELISDPKGAINLEAVKLIVEVADSSLADDMGEKRDDYARSGVVEYWVADVNAKVVHMHTDPRDGAFQKLETRRLDEPLLLLTHPTLVAKIT